MTDIKIVVNEGINISESVSTVIWLNFELYDPVHVPGAITDSDEITFFRDTSDPNTIAGFAIKVKDPDEQKVKDATALGERIVNYLAGKTLVAVRSKRPKIQKQAGNTPQITTTNASNQQGFDLDASKLSSLFSGNDLLNKKVANYQNGMVALEDHDLVGAVQRLYQVIENSGLPEAVQYKPLRVACSHDKVDDPNTINALNNVFGIKCTAGKPVDFTDLDNWQQLYNHAHALKRVADDHLKKIID
ncbi:MAG: hypothetical protein M3239_07970 [Thermoproteota archaeon]|nr:hypothetical protein [Thermoproteota archaeon]